MDRAALQSFFSELDAIEKTAGLPAIVTRGVRVPQKVYWHKKSQEKHDKQHREISRALDRGTPAGWAALGMRAR